MKGTKEKENLVMKKNYLLSAIAVCACLFTACNKENDATREDGVEENKEGVITHLRATGNENTSKGSIDGATGDFSWNVGDQIAVWDNTNGVYKVSAELTAGDIAGDNATFTFVDLGARADFAVSPASIVDADHHTAADFSITLPGTYSLADVLGEKSPVPMIAVNDGDFLHFKQLGALLRVTLNNLPPSTKSVTIDFNGNKVWGSFPVASTVTPGSSYIVTAAASGVDAGKDVITINIGEEAHGWLDGQDVNIPVPAGTYTNITVKTWSGLNGTGTATLTMTRPIKVASGIAGKWKPIRTSARKVIASLPVFTIDAGVRVQIAPANMYYDSSTSEWKMFDHAYDCTFGQVTAHLAQSHLVPTYHTTGMDPEDPDYEAAAALDEAELEARLLAIRSTANRDLFQWEEIKEVTFSGNDFAGHNDWRWGASFVRINNVYRGTTLFARIILDAKNGFPNLTLSRGNELYSPARTMGGTSGVFYFPDKWDDSLNTTTIQSKKNNGTCKYADGTEPSYTDYAALTDLLAPEITMEVFNQLLDAGAVFIPSSGLIYANGYFSSVGVVGGTWTSTQNATYEDRQNAFYHSVAGINRNGGVGKTQFRSIRLVRDIK